MDGKLKGNGAAGEGITCPECYELMESQVSAPEGGTESDVFYLVEIVTKNDKDTVGNNLVEDMFLEVMNGFFKAELLGCNSKQTRRHLEGGMSVDLRTADFDYLTFDSDAAIGENTSALFNKHPYLLLNLTITFLVVPILLLVGLCDDAPEDNVCRGAEGKLQVIHLGEESGDKVAATVTALLNENAEQISGLLNEFESIDYKFF